MSESQEQSPPNPPEKFRKPRKPRVLLPKQPPIAIRSLWEWATTAEKEQAHRTAAAMMEYWMGQSSKQEIALRLNIPQIRVWQLSQQAISGMVVGLLHPPKNKTKNAQVNPEEDPKKLHRRILELERHVSMQHRLIVILREMPITREAMLLRDQVVKDTQPGRLETMPTHEKDAKQARKAQGLRKS